MHVWRIAASAHLARVPSLHGLLVPEERARAAQFRRKEARLKACGDGLAKGTDHFEVSVDPRAPASLLMEGGALARAGWFLTDLEVDLGYAAALATEGPTKVTLFRG